MAGLMWIVLIAGFIVVVAGFALAGHPVALGLGGLLILAGIVMGVGRMWKRERVAHPDKDLPGFKRTDEPGRVDRRD